MTFTFKPNSGYSSNESVDYEKEYFAHELEDIQYPEGSVVAIFDLDTVVHPTASACDDVTIKVSKSGKSKEFKNRTAFKNYCLEKGYDSTTFTIEDIVVPEPIENCLSSVKKSIERLASEVGATHCEYYLGGHGNFRLSLPLPVQYKSNRKDYRKPTHLVAAQEYVIRKYKAKKICGFECDDVVNIRAVAINKQKGVKGIVITTDKDQLATFSDEVYMYRQGELIHLNDYLGELHLKPNGGVVGSGLKWQLTQALITGDATDEYLPRRHFNKKYGEKSWYKDVKDIDDVKDFLTFAVSKFRSLVGDHVVYTDWTGKEQNISWLELANLYFSAAYMRTSADDSRTFESLLKEWEVEYE